MRPKVRRSLVPSFAALVTCIALAAPASAATVPSGGGKLTVGVEVLHFAAAGRTVQATSMVTGTLADDRGHTSTVHSKLALTAATGGSGCKVLHLDLQELTLNLLGLNAHLDRVILDITGNRSGGVLGSLFCRLSHARIASARVAGVRALNSALRANKIQGHALRFTAYLHPQARSSATTPTPAPAAPPTPPVCPVLDLVVGPLNLQLLGLVVNLNRVHLSVTATPGGGAVGDLFCMLSH